MSKRGFEQGKDQEATSRPEKRRKQDCGNVQTRATDRPEGKLTHNDYTVGWICAIATEYVAAQAFLDERHDQPEYLPPHDNNDYTFGKVGKHNVVIAVLPDGEYGISSAASVAKDMLRSFPNIRVGLMVGIGGGAPSPKHDIRLGDVVVSAPRDGKGGVFQYDFGKTIQYQSFRSTGFLNQPPIVLRAAVNGLKAQYESEGHQLEEAINSILENKSRLRKRYQRPDPSRDRLYQARVTHPLDDEANCAAVCSGDPSDFILRHERAEDEDNLTIHYGLIASGNQLIKDALLRDKLAKENDVLCFEMEAAGLMNHFPCLVVRGICDYSDSHKNKEWQGYAAMAAAAYAKGLLCRIAPNRVEAEKRIADILSDVEENIKNVSKGVDKLVHGQRNQEERRDVVAWISALNFSTRQNDHLIKREHGTGEWILYSKEFKGWLSEAGSTIWCRGIPGAGKTVLTSVVVDHLGKLKNASENTGLAYVYCSYKEREDHTVTNLIANILQQLIPEDAAIPGEIVSLYRHHVRNRTRPTLTEWSKLLQSEVRRSSTVFVVIDALDELGEEDDTRDNFLQELKRLQPFIRLFVTSRPNSVIEQEFEKAIHLEIHAHDSDVRRYLEQRIVRIPRLRRHVEKYPALQGDIINAIIKKSKGMFLLAHLQMDSLVKKDNIKAVRKALSSLPKSLDSIYDEAIKRIRSQDDDSVERAEQILAWLAYASRPLSLTAIQHALAVGDEDEEFDEDAMPCGETLASMCAGLVSIEGESKMIRLVHYTTQEYLRRLKTTRFLQAPATIAATCLRYLSFGAFADGPCPSDEHIENRMQEYPLLDYAARHWGDHARGKPEEKVEELALQFLKQNAKLGCSVQAMHLPAYRHHGYSQNFPRSMTGLHLAASFGLATIVHLLLESTENDDVDIQDSNGRTPLSLAAEKGYSEAAIPVLQHGANVMMKDNRDWTALHWACKQGHEPMARLLAEHGVDIGAKDKQGATALYWAAEKGYEAMVRLLLENGAEVNLREGRGITPLQGASSSGHEGVVRLLLDKGAEIDAKDDYFGRTALHQAAGGGHIRVLQLLLEHGADVNATNNWGRTALHQATGAGREAVTRLLLEHRANTSLKETTQGATALHGAADGGHTTVMSLLIDNGADVIARNEEKWATPLHWAARRGHEKAVLQLVEHGAEVAARDKSDMTALHEAAANGRDGAVRLFLDWIDVETKDDQGATPLHWAATGGHEAAARMLLEKGANARAKDNEGRTALHYAAEAKNTSGTDALHRAAKEGNVVVMRSLLAEGADVNSRDSTGATALHWAAAWGHELAVRLLLENGVEVMAADGYGWTALHRAANDRHGGSSRHEAATWLLLEKVDAGAAEAAAGAESGDSKTGSNVGKPVMAEDDAGVAQRPIVEAPRKILAPLPNAATEGHTKVAQLLLSSGADARAKDCTGKTALDVAVQSRHDAMVLLLQ